MNTPTFDQIQNAINKAFAEPSKEEIDAKVAQLMVKAERYCREAIGAKFSVRKENGMITEGVIIEAKPHPTPYFTGRSVGVKFDIVMECGIKKVRREFTVRQLPRR